MDYKPERSCKFMKNEEKNAKKKSKRKLNVRLERKISVNINPSVKSQIRNEEKFINARNESQNRIQYRL